MNEKEVLYVSSCSSCDVYKEKASMLSLIVQQCSCGLLYRYLHGEWVVQYNGYKVARPIRISSGTGFELK